MDIAAFLGSINYTAIAVSMLATIVVGFIWYSPGTFFNIWWKGIGKGDTKPGTSNMAVTFGLTFVASYLKILGLALVLALASPLLGGYSFLNGLIVAFFFWLLTTAPTYLTNNLFSGFGTKVYLIEAGNHLVDYLVAGVILSLWR